MNRQRFVEVAVGLFIIAGFLALLLLALQVSGLTRVMGARTYSVTATFNNIGGLRVRAPVKVAGVVIGEVTDITLHPKTYEAKVTLAIDTAKPALPVDSSASILTEGLLGNKYISIEPGFEQTMLTSGDEIKETHSAMVLENLIGQFLYNTAPKKEKTK